MRQSSQKPQQSSSVACWYRGLTQRGILMPDAAQENAVDMLQQFADTFAAPRSIIRSDWRRFLGMKEESGDGSLYLHGGVGRGKSFLMDGFFLHAPEERKMRVHFHRFMQRFHLRMKERKGEAGALEKAAADIAAKCRLLCFDEFHVSDIADAMILGRLMESLLAGGVKFVLTSNYHPDGLYPNGLARDRFLPAIDLIKRRFTMVSLDAEGGADYRMRHFDGAFFMHPLTAKTQKRLRAIFDKTACGVVLPPEAKAGGRKLPMIARAPGIGWFSFAGLCEGANGKGDYLSLADRFPMIILSDVPQLDAPQLSEAARRFTWLIDILYDRRIKLIISSATPLTSLYGKAEGGESGRTISRLTEMQSRNYWQQGKAAV